MKKKTLATKLIIYILLFSSFLTLILTSIQIFADYKTEVNETKSQFNLIQNGFLNGLTNAVWFFDEKQIENHLDGIMKIADVAEYKLETNNNIKSVKRPSYSANGPSVNFSLVYGHEGEDKKIGNLYVVLTLDKVYKKLEKKFLIVLISNAIKTFLVSYFIFIIFYRLVSEPLEKIANDARKLSEEQLGLLSPEEIEEIKYRSLKQSTIKGNELDEVRNAIAQMQMNFSYSFDSLKKNQERLKDITHFTSDVVFETDRNFIINYLENHDEDDLNFYNQLKLNENIFDLNIDENTKEVFLNQKQLLLKQVELRSFVFEIPELKGKKYYSMSIRPFYSEDHNEFKGYRGVISDITARKEFEHKIEEQKEQIKQIQKMDAIGELTAGIAHDFNNVLSVISASLKNISKIEIENDNLNKYLLKAINASEKGTKLSKRLLSFSRRQESEEKVVVINDAIESLSEILSVALSSSTRFVKEFSPELWQTKIDINMLENVLINMCVNARDALSKSDDPEVKIITQNIVRNQKEMILVTIKDNGEGMSEEVKMKVFEPFFTTKEKDKGTGLGLSMVYNFVKQYKGEIELESHIGLGTTFKIYLPRYQA